MVGRRLLVVPKPGERVTLVRRLHEGLGNFGVKRVLSMVQRDYRWRGMGDDVTRVVGACMTCARVKARFQECHHEL